MAPTHWIWIALVLLLTSSGVRGRAISALGSDRGSARADEAHPRERCAELAAPWLENTRDPGDNATALRLRGRPFLTGRDAQGPLFPGKALFSFVRRVYQCCRGGLTCRRVKGVQGRLRGGREVEFPLSREILSLSITRAELHLQLSNPQQLDVRPVLPSMAKRNLPTRYNAWSRDNRLELRVDLLTFFQNLQEAAGRGRGPSLAQFFPRSLQDIQGNPWGDGVKGPQPPALELGLMLGCSSAGAGVSCGSGGVLLTHTPFMALYYR